MGQVHFGLKDELEAGVLAASAPGFQSSPPYANVSTDSPGLQAVVREGDVGIGWFEIGSSNKWIDIDEGSGQVVVAFADGPYVSGTTLAAHIQSTLNASALVDTYTVTWVGGVFNIGSTGTFSILWKTGSHGTDNADNNIGTELGFSTTADTSTAGSHAAAKKRWSTAAGFWWDLGSATALHAFLWYAEGGGDGWTASFNDVVAYVDTAYRGAYRDAWVDASSTAISLSKRPADATTEINQIQVGFQDPDTATPYRYGFISWRHWDESADHRIGLVKAFKLVRDTTNARTTGPLRDHQPVSSAPPRSMLSYYVPPGLLRWRVSMTFAEWEIDSWIEVVQEVIEHGLQSGVLWIDDFAAALAADVTELGAIVARGKILWGCVQSITGGNATGQQDAYRTSDLTLEQLR